MPMGELFDFSAVLTYDKIKEPDCEGKLIWFAKPVWVPLMEEMIQSNIWLHRLEEVSRIAGASDRNTDAMMRMRCLMYINFAKFLKGKQDCPDVCLEYESQTATISRRVECP